MLVDALLPSRRSTVTIAVTGSSQTVSIPGSGEFLELQNAGSSVIVFVETGDSTITAAVATGYPILPGQAKMIRRSNANSGEMQNYIAVIGAAAGPTTLYVSPGLGT